jgi:uncharacterized membrane protein
MVTTSGTRNRKGITSGLVVVAVLMAVGVGGAYWWYQRTRPSQASAADCALAQNIIDQAQKLPRDKAAVEKWQKDTRQLRITRLKDGFLGVEIAGYEGWAANRATGEGPTPTTEQLAEMTRNANSHCTAAKRTLVFPPIAP